MNVLADRDFCAALILSLGHFLWQGTVIAGLAAIAATRFRGSRGRYNVLVVAFSLMAICPFVTLAVQSQSVVPTAPSEIALQRLREHAEAFGKPPRLAVEPDGPVVRFEPLATASPPTQTSVEPVADEPQISSQPHSGWQRFAPLLTTVYLLGVALMLLRLMVGLWGGWRLRRRSIPVADLALVQALRRQANSLGMKFVPILAYCERVAVPTVIGILKPTILLPLTVTSGLTADQIEAVLAHELAHVRRYDHLVNLLQRLVESLLFFHPAVWWLSHRIRIERELCCDDLVVACGATPLDYAKSLLRVAELSRMSSRNHAVSAVSLLATGQPSTLRQRIARLLGDTADHQVRFQHRWPALLLGVICLFVAWTTTRVGWSDPDESSFDQAKFVATLPNGATVELMGVGYHQDRLGDWWNADGARLPKAPHDPELPFYNYVSVNAGGKQNECREFAVRISGVPRQEGQFDWQFLYAPYGTSPHSGVIREDAEFRIAEQPPISQHKLKTAGIRILMDELPDEVVRSFGMDCKKLGAAPTTAELRRIDDLVQPIRVDSIDGQTELILKVMSRLETPPVSDYAPEAIDTAGERHGSIRAGGRDGVFSYLYPIARERIARFEYRFKRYRNWVTFTNVSLHPGEKSDVQVKAESLPDPPPVVLKASEELPQGAVQRFGTGRFRVAGPFKRIEVTPDGRSILVLTNARLTVLDRETGLPVVDPRYDTGTGWVQYMGISPDGRYVAVMKVDDSSNGAPPNYRVVVLDTQSPQRRVFPWDGYQGETRSLVFSPDNKTLVGTSEKTGLKIWNLNTGEEIAPPKWANNQVRAAAFSADGKTLVVVGSNTWFWNWQTDEAPRQMDREYSGMNCAAKYSPDGKWLVTGYSDINGLPVFDAKTLELAGYVDVKRDRIYTNDTIAISHDSRFLVVGLVQSKRAEVWNLQTRLRVHSFDCPEFRSAAFSRDGKWLVVARNDCLVDVRDMSTGKSAVAIPEGHLEFVDALRFDGEGRTLLSASGDGTARIWDVATGKPTQKLEHSEGHGMQDLSISPDGRLGVTSSHDNKLAVWDLKTGKRLQSLSGHGAYSNSRPVQFTPGGGQFVSWGEDMHIRCWNSSDGDLLATHATPIAEFVPLSPNRKNSDFHYSPTGQFSSDLRTLLVELKGQVHEFETETGKERRQFPIGGDLTKIALSPDQNWLVSSHHIMRDPKVENSQNESVVTLQNFQTLKTVWEFKTPAWMVWPLVFSPDSKSVAYYASNSRSIDVVNVQTGAVTARIGGVSRCYSFQFTPDSKQLASGHEDSAIFLWDLSKFAVK